MPNWCENTLTIKGTKEQWDTFLFRKPKKEIL